MPIKMTLASVGGTAIEITGDTPNEVIKSAAFWTSLPVLCPICGNPLNFDYRKAQDKHDYYILVCEGEVQHQTNLGIKQDGKDTLYYKGDGMYTNPTDGTKTHAWSVWDSERNRRIGVLPGGDAPRPSPKSNVVESASGDEAPWTNEDGGVEYGADGWPVVTSKEDAFLTAIVDKAREMGVTYAMVVNSDLGEKLKMPAVSGELVRNADVDWMRDVYKATVAIGNRAKQAAAKK